jgi:hypothetical protein
MQAIPLIMLKTKKPVLVIPTRALNYNFSGSEVEEFTQQ